ncbi:MAG: hypothetical protein M1114_03990 [Candidatus Dependentiae bacterium]|nr:hypothetical protein [Candidatus Dependentiae bacterium]
MKKSIKIYPIFIALLATTQMIRNSAMENFFTTEKTISTTPYKRVEHTLHSYSVDSENFKTPGEMVQTAYVSYANNTPTLILGAPPKIADDELNKAAERFFFKAIVQKLKEEGIEEFTATNPQTLISIPITIQKKKKNRAKALYQR